MNENIGSSSVVQLIEGWIKEESLRSQKKKDEGGQKGFVTSRMLETWRSKIEPQLRMENILDTEQLQKDLSQKLAGQEEEEKLIPLAFQLIKEYSTWDAFAKAELKKNQSNKKELVLHLRDGREVSHSIDLSRDVDSRFFFGLCPLSLTIEGSTPLKVCSGCFCIAYASKEDQKKDWKRHKAFCKTLNSFASANPGHHPLSGRPDFHGKLQLLLTNSLGRQLTQFESDLLVYPRLCAVCLTGNQSALTNCPKCHCVAYCSAQHCEEDKEEHAKSCQLLRICLEDHKQEKIFGRKITDSFVPRPSNYSQNSFVCDDYVKLPEHIEDVFSAELKTFWMEKSSVNTNDVIASELRRLTFRYTCPLTVLYGAERAGLASGSIDTYERLVIHVVGARLAECKDVTAWEIIAMRLPKLKQLTVVLIGPEVSCSYSGEKDFVCMSSALMELRPETTVRYLFVETDYHLFMTSHNGNARRPDIVAALNCGFVFYNEWNASLADMVKYPNVPLIFTEYYAEDCRLDLQKLDSIVDDELEVVVDPKTSNPFCSSLPARIPTGFAFRRFKRRNVVMSNDYICVVRSMSE